MTRLSTISLTVTCVLVLAAMVVAAISFLAILDRGGEVRRIHRCGFVHQATDSRLICVSVARRRSTHGHRLGRRDWGGLPGFAAWHPSFRGGLLCAARTHSYLRVAHPARTVFSP